MAKCPVTIAFDHSAHTSLIWCGQWDCPNCAKRNSGKWAKRTELALKTFAESGEGDAWMLTLTLGSEYTSVLAGYRAIPKLWDSTRKAYQRYYGTFTYIAFVEGQRKRGGMPHFHILTPVEPPTKRGRRGYVTKRGTHDFAVAFGWGFEAELELVTGSQAAVYVSKYTSKGDPSMPRNFRRVRVSRDIPELPDLGGSPLLVPSRSEDVAHFVARVVDATGVNAEDVYKAYTEALQWLHNEQERRETPLKAKQR